MKIITGEQSGEFLVAYLVLGVSVVFEGGALIITIREFLQGARAQNRSFWDHFRTTRNTTIKVPLYEDTAALVGIIIAAAGLLLSQLTGSAIPDAIGSFAVGAVLVFVSWRLTVDSRALLLGEAVPAEHEKCLYEVINSFDEVEEILRLLTMQISPEAVLVNAEIHVAEGLETEEIEDLLERISQTMREEVSEVSQTFLELHEAGHVG